MKVVFFKDKRIIRVYKGNAAFDFDNFNEMSIEFYMECLDALRAGKYEVR